MSEKKPVIVQQATDLSAIGGTTSEFNALKESSLSEKYEIVPMVLPKVHKKISLQDIQFYYDFLKKTRPDIVQIRGAAVDGLNAQIAARMVPGTKILVCVHGMFSELVYMSPIKRMMHEHIVEPIIFHMCDGISCVYKKGDERHQLKKYKSKLLPYVYNRMPCIEDIPSEDKAALRRELRIPAEAVVGVYCGRFNKEKGLSYLLDAFQLMKEVWPENLHLLMIGDGDYRKEFSERCADIGISEKVHCIGAKQNVHPYLRISDFFIMPSLHENHSIALLEALAADLPVVSTDVGGNGEIVRDGIEGILIPSADSKKLGDAILKISNDEELRKAFKNNIAKSTYPQFSNASVDAQLDSVYQKMLSKGLKK